MTMSSTTGESGAIKLCWYLNTVLVLILVFGSISSIVFGTFIEKVCLFYTMHASIFSVHMGPGVREMAVNIVLGKELRSKLEHKRAHEYDFEEFHSFVCQLPALPGQMAPCQLWDYLKAANYVLLVCGGFGLAVMVAGWLMERQYCSRPREQTKKTTRILYAIGPILCIVGCGVYWHAASQMKDMIPSTPLEPIATGFWFFVALCGLSPAPVVLQFLLSPSSLDELENEVVSIERKNLREQNRSLQVGDQNDAGGSLMQSQIMPGAAGGIYGSVNAYSMVVTPPPLQPMFPVQRAPAW